MCLFCRVFYKRSRMVVVTLVRAQWFPKQFSATSSGTFKTTLPGPALSARALPDRLG
jgi:hypothetical protein